MPKPSLEPGLAALESSIIETLIAGHKEWRPDLSYPESYSDMQGAVRGLLRMFEVKRRSIAITLKLEDRWIRDFKPHYKGSELLCQFCDKPWGHVIYCDVPVCEDHHKLLSSIHG